MIHWIDGIELSWYQNSPQWIDTVSPVGTASNGSEYAAKREDRTKDDEKVILDFIVFFSQNYLRG